MSYEVIARRWRPQDFTGLVGQDHVRTTLLNALKNDRLHHALLLTGPRGTGKTSTARILAKALRCPNAVDFVPCNQCSECEEITAGRSVNVVEIDGASNNGVDAIRELRDTVGYLPSSGKFKMYIIDEVHMLSTSAFNALLKTLEEPPAHVYFVMATTEAHKIPNTILSRCQRFDFRRIPTRVIAQHLQLICERDQVQFEAEALWTIARQGDGSMRDAQSLLDQVINFTAGNLRRDLVVSTLGLTDRGLLNDLLAAICAGEIQRVIEGLKGLHQSGGDPKLLLLDLMEQIRNTLLLKLSSNTALVDLPDSEKDTLMRMCTTLTSEDLHLLFDMALKGAQDLARASDTLLVLEMVLMRMTTAPRIAFVQGQPTVARPTVAVTSAPSNNVQQARRPAPATAVTSAATVSTIAATPPPTPARPISTNSPVEIRFKELVEKVKEVNGLVGAQLENCFILRMDGKNVTLGISGKHKFLFDKMNQPDFKKKVVNYMNSYWGSGHALEVQLSEPGTTDIGGGTPTITPKALSEKAEEDQKAAIRKAVEAHPLVQSTQSVFKTEIKSIKEIPLGDRAK
ncbi:MAG: DNA polymerase III subunit gamma/tau [Bdellovibrionales bacterium]|nr:DNA polymerase III subunit gamma/tau [Bdellovibrionales bacterium]